jgi:hypothetical protein
MGFTSNCRLPILCLRLEYRCAAVDRTGAGREWGLSAIGAARAATRLLRPALL